MAMALPVSRPWYVQCRMRRHGMCANFQNNRKFLPAHIPRVSGDTMTGQGLYVTQRLNKLLVTALDEAKKLKDDYVSVEHLVLAMFSEPATTDIGKIVKTFDLRREKFLQALT